MADGDSLGIMATTVGSGVAPRAVPRAAADVPKINYAVLFAATSAVVGVIWDISWHRTIGRDTFWTPAHIAIYLSGIVAGSCGWLVLRTTFRNAGREGSRRVVLGISRTVGRVALHLGRHRDDHLRALRQLVAQRVRPGRESAVAAAHTSGARIHRDRAGRAAFRRRGTESPSAIRRQPSGNADTYGDGGRRTAGLFVAYGFGVLLCNFYIMGFEYIAFPNDMHKMLFYQVCCARLSHDSRGCGSRGTIALARDAAAAVYMGIHLLMIWILQSFPRRRNSRRSTIR